MAHSSHHHDIAPPKRFELPGGFQTAGLALFVLGLVVFVVGLLMGEYNAVRAWRGYIIGFWFTLSLGLSGPFFIATQYLAKAGWSVAIRRVPEAFGAFLLPVIIFGAIALLGAETLFKWLPADPAENHYIDAVVAAKSGFLNFTGIALTTIASTLAWFGFFTWMRRNSLKQDEVGGYKLTHTNIWVSAGFLLVFVIGFSFMSWYWIMSFNAHWYSTMFSVYAFAGLFQSGLSVMVLIILYLKRRGYFGDTVGTQHIHDMGKLVFAFTVFYAYIGFSQFLLIWYANIPEAAEWYVHRTTNGWGFFLFILPFIKFIIPFLLLLPQEHKKNKNNILQYVCGWLILTQLYEVWLWVAPYPAIKGSYSPLWPVFELPIALGFVGLFIVVVGRSLAKHNLVPLKDPFLAESIPHSHDHLIYPNGKPE